MVVEGQGVSKQRTTEPIRNSNEEKANRTRSTIRMRNLPNLFFYPVANQTSVVFRILFPLRSFSGQHRGGHVYWSECGLCSARWFGRRTSSVLGEGGEVSIVYQLGRSVSNGRVLTDSNCRANCGGKKDLFIKPGSSLPVL